MCFKSYEQPNLLIALIKHNVKLSEHLPCALSSLPLSTWGSERGKVGPAAEGRNLALSFSLFLAIARVEWEGGDILCRWYHHRLRRVWGRMPPSPSIISQPPLSHQGQGFGSNPLLTCKNHFYWGRRRRRREFFVCCFKS